MQEKKLSYNKYISYCIHNINNRSSSITSIIIENLNKTKLIVNN